MKIEASITVTVKGDDDESISWSRIWLIDPKYIHGELELLAESAADTMERLLLEMRKVGDR